MSNKTEKSSAENTGLQGRSFDCLEDEVDALLQTIGENLKHVDEIMKEDFLSATTEAPASVSTESATVEDEPAASNHQETEMDEVKTPSDPTDSVDGETPIGVTVDLLSSEDEASSSSQEGPEMIVEEAGPIDQAIESAVDQMLQTDDRGNEDDNDGNGPAVRKDAEGISESVAAEVADAVSISEPVESPADAESRTDPESVEPESTAEADDPSSIDVPIDQMLTEAVAASGFGQAVEEIDRVITPTAVNEFERPTPTKAPTSTIPTPEDEPPSAAVQDEQISTPIPSEPSGESAGEQTESEDAGNEATGTEAMSEDDLEDLDRMLAEAADRVCSEDDEEIRISSSTAIDEMTPKIKEPSVDAIEPADTSDSGTAQTRCGGQASQSATDEPAFIDLDSDSIVANEVLSPLPRGRFGALILKYPARLGERLPAPVAKVADRLFTKIAAIPFRQKLTEWGMAALARANRPWLRFPKDLQIGLLIITASSFTLGVVAILIAWMRGG